MSGSSQEYDGGKAQLRPPHGRTLRAGLTSLPQNGFQWQRHRMPCTACGYPLVPSDKECPRCQPGWKVRP